MRFCRKIALPVVVSAVALASVGCSSLDFGSKGPFDSRGLPKEQYLVGGGMDIRYVAPEDGRLCWVEQTSGKILSMKSVKADEAAEFGSSNMDPDLVKERLGVALKDADFRLYFVPNEL